jgi:hypothetical protein
MCHLFGIEDLRNNRVQVLPREVRVVVLADILDELHDLHRITVSLDPKAELLMLLSDFFERLREKIVHLFDGCVEVGAADVRVVADEVGDLGPLHLHTIVMEVAAFGALEVSLFAYHCRPPAPAIDANAEYVVFVWAL